MVKKIALLFLVSYVVFSCQRGEEVLSEAEKERRDSISRVGQKRKADSLKKLNPLLILPPDSEYTGDYLDKYPDGIVKYRGFFRFGKRHGQWVAFFGNGNPWSEQNYDKGLRNGPNIVYYENGSMRYSGFYKNDKRDSVWVFYDTLGKALKQVVYKNDAEISSQVLK
jgi:hypothetical protein